jgi:methionine-rich copper-binding protein CopC
MKAAKLPLLSALVLALGVGVTRIAFAHSFPEQETPAAGDILTSLPSEVTIKYDAPIEKIFAKLQVLDSNGKDQAVGQPVYGSDSRTLSTKVAPLKPGEYTVKWAVVCVDTHRTEGSYTFTVRSR